MVCVFRAVLKGAPIMKVKREQSVQSASSKSRKVRFLFMGPGGFLRGEYGVRKVRGANNNFEARCFQTPSCLLRSLSSPSP